MHPGMKSGVLILQKEITAKLKTIKNSSTTSYTNTKLKAGRYYYKVRAYKTSTNENVYSSFTKYVGTTVKILDIMKYAEPKSGSYAAKFPVLIKKIGGMTKKNNSRYPAFYAAGNKMIIGANNIPDILKDKITNMLKIMEIMAFVLPVCNLE